MRNLIFTLAIISTAAPAIAQSEAPVGVRASGMAGAFVAVADDASAVFWNPAGLASGSYFSVALDYNLLQTPDDTSFPHRRSGFLIAVGAPALGVSYFTTTVTRAAETVAEPTAIAELGVGRNTDGLVRVERLEARHIGATVVQSIGRHMAVGGTLRLVRGEASTGVLGADNTEAFDKAGDLFPREGTTKFDTDLGVMFSGTIAKAGLAVRNLFEPEFSTPGGATIALERRIRGGVSVLMLQTITLAADFDFTKAPASLGEWRDAAIGAEVRPARRAWVRAGIHWNTAGGDSGPGAAPVGSVGGSYAVYGSLVADGQYSFGSENGDQGWGVGIRFVF
jgi:F plasmid transfer operon, TraF, protein